MAEQIAPGGGDAGQQQPRWAKVIDQTRCIGCHACTTACKSENEVPVGVTRTYVKHVDVGTFPQARRAHQVTRCNQCAHAPCVAACPTTAMFKRADGIVDFDKSVCIGCKACMAACPYDAIFINPEDHSAEKCNFCAHRIDIGLEPACVVVCPVEAILVGDMDDPASKVGRIVGPRTRQRAAAREGDAAEALLQGRASGDARPARRAPSRRRPLHVERAAGGRGHGRLRQPRLQQHVGGGAPLLRRGAHDPVGLAREPLHVDESIAAGAYLVTALLVLLSVVSAPSQLLRTATSRVMAARPARARRLCGCGSRPCCPARSSPSPARCSSGTWSTPRAST